MHFRYVVDVHTQYCGPHLFSLELHVHVCMYVELKISTCHCLTLMELISIVAN